MSLRARQVVRVVAATLTLGIVVALAPAPANAAGVSATCGQHSQAWIKAFGYGILHSDIPNGSLTVPAGTPIYHTGIVVPGTQVVFHYINLYLYGGLFDVGHFLTINQETPIYFIQAELLHAYGY